MLFVCAARSSCCAVCNNQTNNNGHRNRFKAVLTEKRKGKKQIVKESGWARTIPREIKENISMIVGMEKLQILAAQANIELFSEVDFR